MPEDPPLTCEEIERYMSEMPKHITDRLPDNIERHRAEEHSKIARDYAMQSRAKRPDR
jgi:hypothetical protein